MVKEALVAFGLSDKESTIYLANLELGISSASEIAKKAKFQRELTYVILNRLENKGVITHTIKNHKKHFEAVDPESLIELIEDKRMTIKKSLPELNALKTKPKTIRPKSESYDGIAGIKTIFNNIISFYDHYEGPKVLLGYGSAGKFEDLLRWYLPHFIKKRVKAKINFRAIYNKTRAGVKKKKLPLSEVKFLPKEFESPSFYLIYPNHVVIITFSAEPVGIVIESKDVYESYKMYFKILWKFAKFK